MTDASRSVTQEQLLAHADGRLPEAERAMVLAYLDAHPDKAAELAHWQRQNEAILALNVSLVAEPVPARLDPRHLAAARRHAPTDWRLLAAVAMVLLCLGVGAGWFGRDLVMPPEKPSRMLVESAITAHALYVKESRHAVEVAGSDDGHLMTWLSNRLDRPLGAPDLSAQGFALVGGRLLPPDVYAKAGPAAQLMYENGTADRVTVYITAALTDDATSADWSREDGLDAFYWANDQITCTVVGNLPAAQMDVVARQIYQQLTWRRDPPAQG